MNPLKHTNGSSSNDITPSTLFRTQKVLLTRVNIQGKIIVKESIRVLNQRVQTCYYIKINTHSVIDLSLISNERPKTLQVVMDSDLHGSDHFPVCRDMVGYLPQHRLLRRIIKKADCDLFREKADQITQIPGG